MTSTVRIVCPKCQANNFPGQTNCFRCGAPLPPPEVASQSAYAPSPLMPNPGPTHRPIPVAYPTPPEARRGIPPAIIAVVGLLVILCGGLLVYAVRSRGKTTAPASSDLQGQVEELERLQKQRSSGQASSSGDGADADTQRQIEELRAKIRNHEIGSGDPRSGGITFDQWRRQHPDRTDYNFR